MTFPNLFKLLIFILTLEVFLTSENENGLEKFLMEKMLEYPNWVKDKDPSKPGMDAYSFTAEESFDVNITAKLRNLYVYGHSIALDLPLSISIQGDLNKKSFDIYRNASSVLAGKYTAKGKLKTTLGIPRQIPFSGQGKFKIVTFESRLNYEFIQVKNYAVTTEGYIDITLAEVLFKPNRPIKWNMLEFEGLLDDQELAPYNRNILQTIWSEVFMNK